MHHHFCLAGAIAPLRAEAGLDLGDCFLADADFFPFFGSGVGSGSGGARGSLFIVCCPVGTKKIQQMQTTQINISICKIMNFFIT